ncbi:MalY/PatB family protein [Marinilactibacillus sp. GCM10026970]|uniref:MalY/PatB family protein n=1 Tax=Marinilactibacillus sp. GCM10026970 TaxID=3252642 RepID=UPI00361422D3
MDRLWEEMNFNQVIDRRGTHCTQWDYVEDRFGEKDLLPFTISDTDFALPQPVIHSLSERLNHGVFGYTRWNHDDFKEAVVKWYVNRFGFKVNKEWIQYSPSVIYSVSALIKMHSKKGEGVIIQTPAYDAFFKTIKANKRKLVQNPLLYKEGKYQIDFDDLEKKLSNKSNKILLFCSPHNPTGRVWNEKELTTLIHLCRKHNVFIISDEIHMDVIRKGLKHSPLLKFGEDQVAIVTSGSKTFNFPGLIFSYTLIPNKYDREMFLEQLKNQDGLSSASILGLEATITAYSECENWVEELNSYIDQNSDYVKKTLKLNFPELDIFESESTYLMWLDMTAYPEKMTEIQNRLRSIGKVAIMDGGVYGGNGKHFLRLNIGCPRSKLKQGIERLVSSLI